MIICSIMGSSTTLYSGILGIRKVSDKVSKRSRPTMIVALTCNTTARLTFDFDDDGSDDEGEPAKGNKFY